MSYALTAESFRNARLTYILLAANIILFIIFNVILGGDSAAPFLLDNQVISTKYEIGRFITAMFFHSGWSHLANNMLFLFAFGIATEEFYSKGQYLAIYFGSGIVGNIFQYLLTPPNNIGLGASGAILGLVAAVFIVVVRQNFFFLFLGCYYVGSIIFGSFDPGIGTWAHLFGLGMGFLLGYWFRKQSGDIRQTSNYRPPKKNPAARYR